LFYIEQYRILTVKLANVHELKLRSSDRSFSDRPDYYSLHRYDHYVIKSRDEICEQLGGNFALPINRD